MTAPRRLRLLALTGLVLAIAATPMATPAVADEKPPVDAAAEAYADALKRARSIEASLVKAVAKVRMNSVAVRNLREVKPPGESEPRLMRVSGGSGVIIKYRGKIWMVTNVHVTAGHQALEVVTHDGVTREVEEHDTIPEYDISLLKFTKKPRKLKGVVVKGDYSERGLKEGTWIIATGNPFFLGEDGASVASLGVISGLDRYLGGRYQYVGAIQHDAKINPGNSGGPLWNLKGQLVGINGKMASTPVARGMGPTNTGASFSLPVHQVEAYIRRLVGKTDAAAGYLGLNLETAMDKKGKAMGARVKQVGRRSPMFRDKKRLHKGDIITSLSVKGRTTRIYTADDLREAISLLEAGQEISLKYKSGRKTKRWKGRLGDSGR